MRNHCIALFLALTSSTAASAQDWSRYQPGRLKPIIDAHIISFTGSGPTDSLPHYAVSGRDYATAARLEYTGVSRPLSPHRAKLIEMWQRSFRIDSSVLTLFANEYLFREDSTDLWLAVQKPLEPDLKTEAHAGQVITVLVTFIGGYHYRAENEWLFFVNNFDARER